MNWHFPPGILRRGMCLGQDSYCFYTPTAEQASDERGKRLFLDLTNQEEERGGENKRWRRL